MTKTYTTNCGAKIAVLPLNEYAAIIAGLTPCCGASVSYFDAGYGEYLGCKECFKEVDSRLATGGFDSILAATEQTECPDPVACASDSLWRAEADLGFYDHDRV